MRKAIKIEHNTIRIKINYNTHITIKPTIIQ